MRHSFERVFLILKLRRPLVFRLLSLPPCILLAGGCVGKGLETRLADHRQQNAADSAELLAELRSPEVTTLDWHTAKRLLAERNPGLTQSRLRIERLRKARDEQWKTWLPRVGAYSNLQTSLSQLGNLSFSDLNTSVIAPLSIPNPISERARAFQNALSYLEAQDSYELSYRRQVSFLYRIFSQYDALLAQQADPPPETAIPTVTGALTELESRASRRESLLSIQASLAQILNMPGRNLLPAPSSKPELDYRRKVKTFVPGKNYGQLAMRLAAYQIEGALLREKGVKLGQFPTLSISGSTPPVYNSQDSDRSYFDGDQIFLFGGLTESYDLTGRDAEAVETAEQNTRFVKDSLRMRLDQENRSWIRLQTRYEQVLLKGRLLEERLEAIRSRKTGGSAAAELESVRSARSGLRSLAQAKEALDLELWIWDEEPWKESR